MTSETANLFQRLTRGAYFVIGAAHEERRDIFAATSVMQASHTPLLLAVGVNPRHASYPLMRAGRIFAVSVVRTDQPDTARRFGMQSTRDPGEPGGLSWHCGRAGVPIVDDALAYFECEMNAVMPAGDHEIIVGRVLDCRIPDGHAPSWSYSRVADGDRGLTFQTQPLPAP